MSEQKSGFTPTTPPTRPKGLSRLWGLAAIGVLLLVAAIGNATGGPKPTSPTSAPAVEDSDVQWSDYAPSVRTRIDGLTAARDCSGLQKEFDTAEDNNANTMARLGHNNARLMGYIDAALRSAGCY